MAKFDALYRDKMVFEGFNLASLGIYNTFYPSKLNFGPNSIILCHSMPPCSEKLPYVMLKAYTANIYSQFTVIGCVTCATVISQWLLQPMTVYMTFNDTEEYSFRSIAILGCNVCSQITLAHVTLPKAVVNTVKVFAV